MEYLEKYLYKKENIHGLDTYIIAPKQYDIMLADEEVLNKLQIRKEYIERYMKESKEVKTIKLYLAISYNEHIPKPVKWPLHCLEWVGQMYHVSYMASWFCRDCMHDNGPVVMALVEADSCYYAGLDWTKIPIPNMFGHQRCEKCGHLLQCHLLKV